MSVVAASALPCGYALSEAHDVVTDATASSAAVDAAEHAADNIKKARPKDGDRLVLASTDTATAAPLQPITVQQLQIGAPPLAAWPLAHEASLLRDGSRLNLVRVVRVAADALSARATQNAAAGIVAYAAMCSHAGCDVTGWNAQAQHLVCPCHGSEFAARDAAAVVKGPALRPLAMLPLRIEDDVLVVAGGFTRQVGFKPS